MPNLIESIDNITQIFKKYASKECGRDKLNKAEFSQLIKDEFSEAIKNSDDTETVSRMMKALDENDDGEVDFNEFVVLLCKVTKAYNQHLNKGHDLEPCVAPQTGGPNKKPEPVSVTTKPTTVPLATPAPVKETKLAPAYEIKPTPVAETKPGPVKETKPTPSHETKPTPVLETKPGPLKETKPAPAYETKQTPVAETKPGPVKETKPAPAHETKPTPVSIITPAPWKETKPAPAPEKNPTPVKETKPATVFETKPTSQPEHTCKATADTNPTLAPGTYSKPTQSTAEPSKESPKSTVGDTSSWASKKGH